MAIGIVAAAFIPRRAIRLALIAATALAVLWTSSRSSLFALAIAAIIATLVRLTARGLRGWVVGGVLAALAAVVVALPLTATTNEAFTNRGYIWRASLQAWAVDPWFGLGSQWYAQSARYANNIGSTAYHGHNIFVQLLVLGGIVNVVLVALLVATVAFAAVTRMVNGEGAAPAVLVAAILVSGSLEVSLSFVHLSSLLPVTAVPIGVVVLGASHPLPKRRAPFGAGLQRFWIPLPRAASEERAAARTVTRSGAPRSSGEDGPAWRGADELERRHGVLEPVQAHAGPVRHQEDGVDQRRQHEQAVLLEHGATGEHDDVDVRTEFAQEFLHRRGPEDGAPLGNGSAGGDVVEAAVVPQEDLAPRPLPLQDVGESGDDARPGHPSAGVDSGGEIDAGPVEARDDVADGVDDAAAAFGGEVDVDDDDAQTPPVQRAPEPVGDGGAAGAPVRSGDQKAPEDRRPDVEPVDGSGPQPAPDPAVADGAPDHRDAGDGIPAPPSEEGVARVEGEAGDQPDQDASGESDDQVEPDPG